MLNNSCPPVSGNDLFPDFHKFFPLNFLLPVAVFHITQSLLLHCVFLIPFMLLIYDLSHKLKQLSLCVSIIKDICIILLTLQCERGMIPDMKKKYIYVLDVFRWKRALL